MLIGCADDAMVSAVDEAFLSPMEMRFFVDEEFDFFDVRFDDPLAVGSGRERSSAAVRAKNVWVREGLAVSALFA